MEWFLWEIILSFLISVSAGFFVVAMLALIGFSKKMLKSEQSFAFTGLILLLSKWLYSSVHVLPTDFMNPRWQCTKYAG